MKKLTLKDMQDLARRRGGKCLSMEYTNNHTKLRWQCEKGHVWEAIPNSIRMGSWCSVCGKINRGIARRLTIGEMQELAESREGKCLSIKYVNNFTKLKWQCKEGHSWEAIPSSIKGGRWCPVCGGTIKLSTDDLRNLARSRGGKCMSIEYTNNHTKLRWQCEKGHVWEATQNSVKSGSWCPVCGKLKTSAAQRLTIEEMQELARKKSGECLSKKYVNANTKLKWQCKEGHTWFNTPSHIKQGQWCPICPRNKKILENKIALINKLRKYSHYF